jgi:hypothetical protein
MGKFNTHSVIAAFFAAAELSWQTDFISYSQQYPTFPNNCCFFVEGNRVTVLKSQTKSCDSLVTQRNLWCLFSEEPGMGQTQYTTTSMLSYTYCIFIFLFALHMYFRFHSHFTVSFVHLEQRSWKFSFLILPRTTSLTPPRAAVSRYSRFFCFFSFFSPLSMCNEFILPRTTSLTPPRAAVSRSRQLIRVQQ